MPKFAVYRERVALSIFDSIVHAPRKDGSVPPRQGRLFTGLADPSHRGFVHSDQTANVQKLVMEAKTPRLEDLAELRLNLLLEMIVGEKAFAVEPPAFDKIDPDGVARYDYLVNAVNGGLPIPARQSYAVKFHAVTDRAYEILKHPETTVRVWMVGTLVRDVA